MYCRQFFLFYPIFAFYLAIYASDVGVEKFMLDSSYYDNFSPEVIGVYVIDDEVPFKITEDIDKMARIVGQIIYLRNNPNTNSYISEFIIAEVEYDLEKLLSLDLFEEFSEKHNNHHIEIRDIELLLEEIERGNLTISLDNIRLIYSSINKYVGRKKDFYIRQNNQQGIDFVLDIEKTILIPLRKMGHKLDPNKKESLSISNNKYSQQFKSIMNLNLKKVFFNKHSNYQNEMVYIQHILRGSSTVYSFSNVREIYKSIDQYVSSKRKYYENRDDQRGQAFCDDVENKVLIPLKILGRKIRADENANFNNQYHKKDIEDLNKAEINMIWNDFEKNSLGLLQRYFEARKEELKIPNDQSTFEVEIDRYENRQFHQYFLHMKMFGQSWYFELFKDYSNPSHRISLIAI